MRSGIGRHSRTSSTLTTAPGPIAMALPAPPERELFDAYDDGRVAERVLIAASMLGLGDGGTDVPPRARHSRR